MRNFIMKKKNVIVKIYQGLNILNCILLTNKFLTITHILFKESRLVLNLSLQ